MLHVLGSSRSQNGSSTSSSGDGENGSAAAVVTPTKGQFVMLQQAIAECACACERYVGTEGGGMDQAISVTARAGFAKLVEFNPVSVQHEGSAWAGSPGHSICTRPSASRLERHSPSWWSLIQLAACSWI